MIAYHQLILLAFFFAMRPCEYHKTPKGELRTKPLRLGNIAFRKNQGFMRIDDANIHNADTVSITFEFQKSTRRDETVTQSRNNDPLLCPVKAAATIVRRLRAIGATKNTHIYSYRDKNGKTRELTAKISLACLRMFIATVDQKYNLLPKDIGLHSLRSSSAMAMYLSGVPVYTIMLLGRWASNAFLRYIRKQVAELTNNVSQLMITNQAYYHLPDTIQEDPIINTPLATSTAVQEMAGGGTAASQRVFTVW
jgi:hypothetical protein